MSPHISPRHRFMGDSSPKRSMNGDSPTHMSPELARYFRHRAEKYYTGQQDDQIKEDWMLVSRVLDRLFGWLMFVLFVLEVVLFMYFALTE